MSLKRTPLYDNHVSLGARMVPFAGYEMPVMYTSILEEHEAVRNAAGLFDVSHMSNVWVRGPHAVETLNKVLLCDASKIPVNGSKYSAACHEDGTIIDDLYVFHTPHGYHVVPNAGMDEIVTMRLKQFGKADIENVSPTWGILALQGPKAQAILEAHLGRSFAELKRFNLTQAPELGANAFIARTGYTGEDGFELFLPNARIPYVWEALLDAGKPHGLKACGLGARDTLRLEKGYCLAGHEFKGGRTPLEAGLSWLIQWDHDFIGKTSLENQKARGGHPKLVGIRFTGKGIPREGNEVTVAGKVVGTVTSGTLSPTLKEGIALAYVAAEHSKVDTEVEVMVRGKPVSARVAKLPFV
ncbi:MAG TPA: glycine cleavage system aminomethyltransferase GcvT [Candidatus Thermoplasmatota archaeon]|nr:glycine cleavage system aminomethyltransferase GcvT [Candidatus Thermoplasmatota archaeon]